MIDMNLQKFYLLVIVLMIGQSTVDAQFGVRGKYNINTFGDWNFQLENVNDNTNNKVFPASIEIGVDYWFRLKTYRVEFMPEVLIGLKSTTTFNNQSESDFGYFGLNFGTQFYPFDFEGDCDCPTFSKQGPTFEKGFFFSFTPGVIYSTKNVLPLGNGEQLSENAINFRLGIGVGYDIGISDLFTISPSFSYNVSPSHNFENIDAISPQPEGGVSSSWNHLMFQLRLGFRPDYKSNNFGRR